MPCYTLYEKRSEVLQGCHVMAYEITVFIPEYISGLVKGAVRATRLKLGVTIRHMVLVSQQMSPSDTTP